MARTAASSIEATIQRFIISLNRYVIILPEKRLDNRALQIIDSLM
jgi:hypothetical protein